MYSTTKQLPPPPVAIIQGKDQILGTITQLINQFLVGDRWTLPLCHAVAKLTFRIISK